MTLSARVEVHRSARRHGVHDDDIRNATDHPLVGADLDPNAEPPKQLAIGPDRAGNMLGNRLRCAARASITT
jgi:hypothetical protein